mgnify:CR=1 FL=1
MAADFAERGTVEGEDGDHGEEECEHEGQHAAMRQQERGGKEDAACECDDRRAAVRLADRGCDTVAPGGR